jgi:hypothetical protein
MTKTLAFVLLGLIGLPLSASAQSSDGRDVCKKERGKDHRLCQLTFEPEKLSGKTVGPPDIILSGRLFGQPDSLIRYRLDFLDRIVASTDDR